MKKLVLTLILALCASSLTAGEVMLNNTLSGDISIQDKIYWLKDTEGSLSFKDVHSGKAAAAFRKNSEKTSNFGYSSAAYWIRIKIRQKKNLSRPWFLKLAYPHIDVIDFYQLKSDGTFRYIKTGDALPFSSRKMESRNFLFPLNSPEKTYTVYLRLNSSGAINFPLSIIDSHTFHRQDHREQILYGILFGILLIMIVYNIFVFLSVRERVYIYYVSHIFFLTLYVSQLSGFGAEYIAHSLPLLNNIIDIFATFGALFTVGLFIIDYLETPRIVPKLNRIFTALTFLSGICMVLTPFIDRSNLLYFSAILPILLLLISIAISIIALKHHMRQAWFFLAAWGILIIATALLALSRLTGVESSFLNSFNLSIGIVFNVVFLSLGLADRINRMKNQLFELNIHLEDKVKRRTNQLEDALTEIETTNDHLQERNNELTTAQHIRRKDMAMAISVQNSFLPNVPPVSDKWDIAFMYQPMMGISGDFYDFYTEDGDLKGVGIFDVSGHGIASGLVTMIAKSVILRNFFEGEKLPLNEVMTKTNTNLQKEIGDVGNYITGVLLRFNDTRVEYANAAHNDIIIKRGGEVYFPEEKYQQRIAGAFLGIVDFNYDYESIEFELQKGDYIFLYTDGLNEARNLEDEIYNLEKISKSFETAPDASAQEVLNHIVLDYHEHLRDIIDQQDDITLIVLKKIG